MSSDDGACAACEVEVAVSFTSGTPPKYRSRKLVGGASRGDVCECDEALAFEYPLAASIAKFRPSQLLRVARSVIDRDFLLWVLGFTYALNTPGTSVCCPPTSG